MHDLFKVLHKVKANFTNLDRSKIKSKIQREKYLLRVKQRINYWLKFQTNWNINFSMALNRCFNFSQGKVVSSIYKA